MNNISNWVRLCLQKIPTRKGLVLDLACGKGRHSLHLSSLGFSVLSVDYNEENLNCFSRKNITKLNKDIENKNNWPLINSKFDIIIVTHFLNRSIFPLIIKSIKKGGYLVYETFGEGHQKFGKPKNPDYILYSKELLSLCSSMKLVVYEEIVSINPSYQSIKHRILSLNV